MSLQNEDESSVDERETNQSIDRSMMATCTTYELDEMLDGKLLNKRLSAMEGNQSPSSNMFELLCELACQTCATFNMASRTLVSYVIGVVLLVYATHCCVAATSSWVTRSHVSTCCRMCS